MTHIYFIAITALTAMAVFNYFKSVERKRKDAIRERGWKLEEAIMNYLHQKNKKSFKV